MFRFCFPCFPCCRSSSAEYASVSSASMSPQMNSAAEPAEAAGETTGFELDEFDLSGEEVDLISESEAEKFYKEATMGELSNSEEFHRNGNGNSIGLMDFNGKIKNSKSKSNYSHDSNSTIEIADLAVEEEFDELKFNEAVNSNGNEKFPRINSNHSLMPKRKSSAANQREERFIIANETEDNTSSSSSNSVGNDNIGIQINSPKEVTDEKQLVNSRPSPIETPRPHAASPKLESDFSSPRSPVRSPVLPRRSSGEAKNFSEHSNSNGRKSPGPRRLSNLTLPAGQLSKSQLDDFLSKLDVSTVSYRDIFGLLMSAHHRTLSGDLLRHYLRPPLERFHQRQIEKLHNLKSSTNNNNKKIPLRSPGHGADEFDDELPEVIFHFFEFLCKFTKEFHSDRKKKIFTVKFDFRGESTHLLELTTPITYVLNSKNTKDPYLVCNSNTPVLSTVETRRLIFRNEVEFQLASTGGNSISIVGVRDGDIQLKKYLSFNAGFRFEQKPNLVDFDSENRAYLECNKLGKPMIKNNHYIPKTYDDWIVVTVLKQEVYIGLPRFK